MSTKPKLVYILAKKEGTEKKITQMAEERSQMDGSG
jgi:hypothetical protein